MKNYEDSLRQISSKLTFLYQKEQKGFGHAVYQAREFTEGESVLLLLGDTIYRSNTETPCIRQLLDVYDTYGKAMIAVHEISSSDVATYGVFAGT